MASEMSPEEQFIERFGRAFEADRMPRIAGRIMALMLLEGGPLGFDEIASRLKVSRGSISTNSRLLESLKIIERVTKPGDRRDFFQIASQPGRFLLESAIERLAGTRSTVLLMRESLGDGDPEAASRLRQMEHFYGATMDGIQSALSALESET